MQVFSSSSWLFSVSVGVIAALAGCQDSVATPEITPVSAASAPVVNGQKDTADPAVVLVMGPNFLCTGSLVSKTVVLTARHCVRDEDTGALVPQGGHKISFGSGWDGPGKIVATTGYAFMPGALRDFSTDLAVIFMAEPAPDGIAPLPVNAVDLSQHLAEPMRLVGYGITSSSSNDAGVKRVGTTVLSRVDPTLMYHVLQPSGTCEGDSGGPQFMTIDGVEFIAGVTSFGQQNCSAGEHGAVRPDAFLDWLGQHFDTQFDKVPPTVTITSPGDTTSVAPGFTVKVDAADDRKVHRVVLNIDGTYVTSDLAPPYELAPPANLVTGSHTIEVVAFDDYENAGRASVTVTLAPGCASNDECGDGKECASGVCVGALGSPCRSAGDCGSGQCFHAANDSFCTQDCASDDQCPSGFSCTKPELTPVTKCLASGSGGCAIAAPGAPSRHAPLVAPLLWIGLLVLVRRRRG